MPAYAKVPRIQPVPGLPEPSPECARRCQAPKGTTGFCFLLACLMTFFGPGPTLAASTTNTLLSAEDLYRLTIRELDERLARSERFTALPPNVAGVFGADAGTPLFLVANEPGEQPSSNNPTDYVQDQGSFRVVRSGSILGASAEEVVLMGAREFSAPGSIPIALREVLVVGKAGVRRLESPNYQPVSKAFRTGSGWGFLSSRGVLLHSTTNLAEVDLQTKDYLPGVIEGSNECVILTRPLGFGTRDKPARLVITTQDRNGTNEIQLDETQAQSLAFQGLVRSRDGRWLAIGTRIAPLRADQPAAPSEQLLTAVLKAVQTTNASVLSNALESATVYAPEHLRGLVQLLQAVPEPFGNARALVTAARESLPTARNWKPPEGISPAAQTQASAAMGEYAQNLERFLARVDQIRSGPLGISPATIASRIQAGYQHFSGWWIGPPRLLRQQGPRSVLLDCIFLSQTNTARRGIFQLDEDARLRLLGDYEAALESTRGNGLLPEDRVEQSFGLLPVDATREPQTPLRRPCEYAGTDGRGILLFFPFQGLGRVADGMFEWVDRSEPFRRMERVVALDPQGRIYLLSAPSLMSRGRTGGLSSPGGDFSPWAYPVVMDVRARDLWVYRRSAPAAPSPIQALYPVVSLPVMDPKQRVWFLPIKPSTNTSWPKGVGALGDTPAAEASLKKLMAVLPPPAPPKPSTSTSAFDLTAAGRTTDLCRYEAGQLTVAATNVPFEMILSAASSEALLGYSWSPRVSKALLLDRSGLTWADSLHELALHAGGRLLEAAPTAALHPSTFVANYDFTPEASYPAIARMGDYVWIHHLGRTEVYHDGKALGVPERLTLLNCPPNPILEGPINTANGPAMVIMGRKGSWNSSAGISAVLFWAFRTNDTVELVRGPEKDMDGSIEVPLINAPKGRVYLPRFILPVTFWMVSAPDRVEERPGRGVPTWVDRNGDLLTARTEHGYAGWRLEADDSQRDYPLSYARRLRVLHEAQDGKLLCQSPEGVLWLRRAETGDYAAAGEIQLHTGAFVLSFVGETSSELFLTLVDARQNAYLAVLNKP